MRHRLPLPAQVKESIKEHFRAASLKAPEIYTSASEDEDTITGDFGSSLRTGWHTVDVVDQTERATTWRWKCTYYKFRGRGGDAAEKHLGADGIFELTLDTGEREETKSVLFQAKKDGDGGQRLLRQAIRLSTWREAAFVMNYSEKAFTALLLDDVIEAKGGVAAQSHAIPLDDFLGRQYLDCDIGDFDLKYEPRAKRLTWRTASGEIVGVAFRIRHRIAIKVESTLPRSGIAGVDRMVTPSEIHSFRMDASDEDILALAAPGHDLAPKKMLNRLMLAYHPDRFPGLDDELRRLVESRTKEFNAAMSFVRRTTKRR